MFVLHHKQRQVPAHVIVFNPLVVFPKTSYSELRSPIHLLRLHLNSQIRLVLRNQKVQIDSDDWGPKLQQLATFFRFRESFEPLSHSGTCTKVFFAN